MNNVYQDSFDQQFDFNPWRDVVSSGERCSCCGETTELGESLRLIESEADQPSIVCETCAPLQDYVARVTGVLIAEGLFDSAIHVLELIRAGQFMKHERSGGIQYH